MGTGTDIAMESAQATLVKGDLNGIARAAVEPRDRAKHSDCGGCVVSRDWTAVVAVDRRACDELLVRLRHQQLAATARQLVAHLIKYGDHAEYSAKVLAPVERVFDWLDDQKRLSQHMRKRSWKMGWGKMEVELDAGRGRAVGSHIVLRGRVLGIRLSIDEVLVEHQPPLTKMWETVGEPRLLVIGPYRMGIELASEGGNSSLRVAISCRRTEFHGC